MNITTNEHGAVYLDGEIVGYIRDGGCDNEACLAAIAKGKTWHLIPAGGAATLPTYHDSTERGAIDVLVSKATGWRGEHAADCSIVRERTDLYRDIEADPGNDCLIGAWFEYFDGGDQEVENCTCGGADKYHRPVAGTRVRLLHDVERFPHFIAPAGATGIVVDLGDPWVFAVRLDETLPGAEEWENEVHWMLGADVAPTSADLEVLA